MFVRGGSLVKVEILGKRGLKVVNLNRRRAVRELCLSCAAWLEPDVENCIFEAVHKQGWTGL